MCGLRSAVFLVLVVKKAEILIIIIWVWLVCYLFYNVIEENLVSFSAALCDLILIN